MSKNINHSAANISRSQASDDMVSAGVMTERDRIGNAWADKYADLGAALSAPTPDQVKATENIHAQARYVPTTAGGM